MAEGAEAQPIRVLIVDDHAMVGQALKVALDRADDIEVLGYVPSLGEAITHAAGDVPDVVVLDYQLPGEDSMEGLERFRAQHPGSRVLVFSGGAQDRAVARAMEAGCSGYIVKEGSLTDLVETVRRVHRGEVVFSPGLLEKAMAHLSKARASTNLTKRELDVLELLALGESAESIAAKLVLSVNTVRNHIQNLLAKLGVHSRLEAVAEARRQGLLDAG